MFGVIVSGRLVQTDFQQCDQTKFATTITDADSINHVVVFLTGVQSFPHGTGGLVYFSWPEPNAPPTWHLLGYIANDKPSAIFKISGLKKSVPHSELTPFAFGQQLMSHNAQIGISVEPLASVQQQAALINNQTASSFLEFGQKMIQNFVNFTSSFAVTAQQMNPVLNETYVPLSTLQTWYTNFERRLQQNPYFWR